MQRVWVWLWLSMTMAFDRSTRWFAENTCSVTIQKRPICGETSVTRTNNHDINNPGEHLPASRNFGHVFTILIYVHLATCLVNAWSMLMNLHQWADRGWSYSMELVTTMWKMSWTFLMWWRFYLLLVRCAQLGNCHLEGAVGQPGWRGPPPQLHRTQCSIYPRS